MKKFLLILVVAGVFLLGSFFLSDPSQIAVAPTKETQAFQIFQKSSPPLVWPLADGEKREKKLTFGLYVTPNPDQNPIDPPERFTGYHTALDLEILPGEEETDVPVFAACDGQALEASEVPGYGGVIVQSCLVNQEEVRVLYGHLDFHQFTFKVGDEIQKGDQIAVLGAHKSEESGQTRKHLHFGIHKGKDIELRGYVLDEKELEHFIDPLPLLTSED